MGVNDLLPLLALYGTILAKRIMVHTMRDGTGPRWRWLSVNFFDLPMVLSPCDDPSVLFRGPFWRKAFGV